MPLLSFRVIDTDGGAGGPEKSPPISSSPKDLPRSKSYWLPCQFCGRLVGQRKARVITAATRAADDLVASASQMEKPSRQQASLVDLASHHPAGRAAGFAIEVTVDPFTSEHEK